MAEASRILVYWINFCLYEFILGGDTNQATLKSKFTLNVICYTKNGKVSFFCNIHNPFYFWVGLSLVSQERLIAYFEDKLIMITGQRRVVTRVFSFICFPQNRETKK